MNYRINHNSVERQRSQYRLCHDKKVNSLLIEVNVTTDKWMADNSNKEQMAKNQIAGLSRDYIFGGKWTFLIDDSL